MRVRLKMDRLKITVGKDGTFVIPKEFQDKYNLEPGRKITFESDDEKRIVGNVL